MDGPQTFDLNALDQGVSGSPSNSVLEHNLRALASGNPALVEALRASAPRTDLAWIDTDEGLSAALELDGRALASRRRPRSEAFRLGETADVHAKPCVAVLGFGLGYHAAEIARRMRRTGVVIVFEPDVALLRAVLERVDCSAWLDESNVRIVTNPDDSAALGGLFHGAEGLIASGVQIVKHPPSMARLGRNADRFVASLSSVLKALKLQVVTTLMQSEVSLRNVTQNLDHYAGGAGVADLAGAARGRVAITIAAGPSLARNIERLSEPGLRDRAVIIAAQTVLRPLLERGVRPHYVTAIDYHEISRRFYEGLAPADVEGVTLVASPRANPAILESFPGAIRLLGEEWTDKILGPALARPMGDLPASATVAHLSYSLARYLGCDPVVLVGQDLGFTDGQYYAANAAIHRVWQNELNDFNTLEGLEWQRIVRMRTTLSRATDTLGRPIFTDEQMHSYLQQFEEMFAADASRGLRTIDATEGGVAKKATDLMPLDEALRLCARHEPLELPPAPMAHDRDRVDAARDRLRVVADDVTRVADLSRESADHLRAMQDAHDDQDRVNTLIARVESARDEVVSLQPAYDLAHHLNQVGTLKRILADRRIELDDHVDPLERQKRQIERDATNVTWLGDAADVAARVLREAHEALGTGVKITRAPTADQSDVDLEQDAADAARAALDGGVASKKLVIATIPVLDAGAIIAEPIADGLNALQLTLRRVAQSRRIDRAVVLTDDVDTTRRLLDGIAEIDGLCVEVRAWTVLPCEARTRTVRAARLLAPDCWRGAPANMSVYDELLDPAALGSALDAENADAACLIGPDWALVDPALIDACVERYLEHPDRRRFVFTQAAPGLAPVVLDRSMLTELEAPEGQGVNVFASIGGLTGYVPVAPQADPIVKSSCVPVDPALRDLPARVTASTPERHAMLIEACANTDAATLSGEAMVERVHRSMRRLAGAAPRELTLELGPGRLTSGPRGRWLRRGEEPSERPAMPTALALKLAESLGTARRDAVLHLAGEGDPLLHGDWRRIVARAHEAGVACVHLRTDLIATDGDPEALAQSIIESGVDAISVDVLADTAETYRELTGTDHFDLVRETLVRLLQKRVERADAPENSPALLATPLIIPRLTRCDAVYEEIERFYDRWLMLAGACVIDPLPSNAAGGDRIRPLPAPAEAIAKRSRDTMLVRSDGRSHGVDVAALGLEAAWRDVQRKRASRVSMVAA